MATIKYNADWVKYSNNGITYVGVIKDVINAQSGVIVSASIVASGKVTINGLSSFWASTKTEPIPEEVSKALISYPIYIFDDELTPLGIIDNYEYLRFNFRYRKVDSFEFSVNRYKNNTEFLQLGNIIALYINSEYRAGLIEDKELSLTEEGKISENYRIVGRGIDGLLAERIALYGTGDGDGYDGQSGKAETLMRHYVDVNCISETDDHRNYSLLELESDGLRGGDVKYEARFQSLDEILEDISLASGLGWGIVLDIENKKLLFRVYNGLDRSWGNGVNAPVMFVPEFGNIKLITYKNSRVNSKNVSYVGGQGEAELRDVDKVTKEGENYTDMERREFFIDARDLDTEEKMLQRGNERLTERGEEIVVEMENLEAGPFEFGKDFDKGDIVTINYPDIVKIDARVVESILEVTPEKGKQNKLIIGREYPDLINIIKEKDKNINPEIRR